MWNQYDCNFLQLCYNQHERFNHGKSKKHQTIEKKFVNLKMPKCISVNNVQLEAAFSNVFYEFHLFYGWT